MKQQLQITIRAQYQEEASQIGGWAFVSLFLLQLLLNQRYKRPDADHREY